MRAVDAQKGRRAGLRADVVASGADGGTRRGTTVCRRPCPVTCATRTTRRRTTAPTTTKTRTTKRTTRRRTVRTTAGLTGRCCAFRHSGPFTGRCEPCLRVEGPAPVVLRVRFHPVVVRLGYALADVHRHPRRRKPCLVPDRSRSDHSNSRNTVRRRFPLFSGSHAQVFNCLLPSPPTKVTRCWSTPSKVQC